MKFAIIVFPGSNCDADCHHALGGVLGAEVEYVWHDTGSLAGFDCVILPGGFSYGDYLRPGAIARFAPVMGAVADFAARGGPVLGICNGFQILCEAGLLPGALYRNTGLRFVCRPVHLRVETARTPFTAGLRGGQVLELPIAHGEGNYYLDPDGLKRLKEKDQIVLRYCSPAGLVDEAANPNGSVDNIAAVCNERGNVVGMMPHPERYVEQILGGTDGRLVLGALLESRLLGEWVR